MPRIAFPALLAAVLLVGCSSSSPSYPTGPSIAASLVVVNNASQPVYYLYASSCSSSSWGPDRLATDQVIMPGTTASFTMTTGCWDLKAVYRDGSEVVRRNAQISASDWRWTLG